VYLHTLKHMSESDKVFSGSIPDIYDDYLVPLIFEQYAEDLAHRTAAIQPNDVLEIAAGSGVVTRAVAPILGEEARYVVTDLNLPMLDRARGKQSQDPRIRWRPADALDLPFPDESFDLVLCQFGVMFFPDRVRAYQEAHRVLRPGGSILFNMWDRIEKNEFAEVVTNSLAGVFPDDPPRFLTRTPHGHHDPTVYFEELSEADFGPVTVDTVTAISWAGDPSEPAVAYCQGTPLRNEIEERDGHSLDEATSIASEAVRERFGDGPVEGKIQGFVVHALRSSVDPDLDRP
jgi:ubiquinone/menaquinone biosynthesis C-methylase UbiE